MKVQTRLRTIGEIARAEGVPRHVVDYAVSAYRITETQRAGIIRLFDEDAIHRIRAALRRIAGRRRGA